MSRQQSRDQPSENAQRLHSHSLPHLLTTSVRRPPDGTARRCATLRALRPLSRVPLTESRPSSLRRLVSQGFTAHGGGGGPPHELGAQGPMAAQAARTGLALHAPLAGRLLGHRAGLALCGAKGHGGTARLLRLLGFLLFLVAAKLTFGHSTSPHHMFLTITPPHSAPEGECAVPCRADGHLARRLNDRPVAPTKYAESWRRVVHKSVPGTLCPPASGGSTCRPHRKGPPASTST